MFASCIICFIYVIRYINIYCVSTCTNFGNVQFNWPKLFQAFFVKFTVIFFMSVFIQSFHISTCKNYAY